MVRIKIPLFLLTLISVHQAHSMQFLRSLHHIPKRIFLQKRSYNTAQKSDKAEGNLWFGTNVARAVSKVLVLEPRRRNEQTLLNLKKIIVRSFLKDTEHEFAQFPELPDVNCLRMQELVHKSLADLGHKHPKEILVKPLPTKFEMNGLSTARGVCLRKEIMDDRCLSRYVALHESNHVVSQHTKKQIVDAAEKIIKEIKVNNGEFTFWHAVRKAVSDNKQLVEQQEYAAVDATIRYLARHEPWHLDELHARCNAGDPLIGYPHINYIRAAYAQLQHGDARFMQLIGNPRFFNK